MRCASCREIFEAVEQGTNQFAPARHEPDPPAPVSGPEAAEDIAAQDITIEAAEDGQIDFDSIDIGAEVFPPGQEAPDPFDSIVLPEAAPAPDERDPAERALEAAALRREKRPQEQPEQQEEKESPAYVPPPRSGFRKPSAATILMVGGLWTLITIGVFRNEITRLVPETIPAFSALGMEVNRSGLDIVEVRSAVALMDGQETLEISGRITNLSKISQKLPVLRLALRNAAGLDIYVWTSAADKSELAGGESIAFTRKLASPPPEAQSVMVRFVAKDDIISSIR